MIMIAQVFKKLILLLILKNLLLNYVCLQENDQTRNPSFERFARIDANKNHSKNHNPSNPTFRSSESRPSVFRGYIPPLNYLEDPPPFMSSIPISNPSIEKREQNPTISSRIESNSKDPNKMVSFNEANSVHEARSIQDLLEPAEADQSQTTDSDQDPSEEIDDAPDDDEYYGLEPDEYSDDQTDGIKRLNGKFL